LIHRGRSLNSKTSAVSDTAIESRTTQLWDAEAINRTTGKTMALFRCTQVVLYPH
jgi:hypothetical protein